jgi:hypothetical protein
MRERRGTSSRMLHPLVACVSGDVACAGKKNACKKKRDVAAYVSIRQHTSAYVSIRQHTSAYVRKGGGVACASGVSVPCTTAY